MFIFINKLDATPHTPHPYLYDWWFLACANLEIVLFSFHCSVVSQQSVLLRVDKYIKKRLIRKIRQLKVHAEAN